jgi:hypothetical protein
MAAVGAMANGSWGIRANSVEISFVKKCAALAEVPRTSTGKQFLLLIWLWIGLLAVMLIRPQVQQ